MESIVFFFFNFWLLRLFITVHTSSLQLQLVGTVLLVWARGSGCTGSVVAALRLSCPMVCGGLPRLPGIEPCVP